MPRARVSLGSGRAAAAACEWPPAIYDDKLAYQMTHFTSQTRELGAASPI